MANPKLPTNGTNELQERYADTVVKLMRPSIKIRNTFGRDYIGDPKSGAVKIPVRGEVAVGAYDVASGKTITTSATSYKTITVDKNYAINELIDGYEAAAVPDNMIAQRLESGAYSMAKQLETDAIAALLTGTASTQSDSSEYTNIVKDIAILAKKGCDKNKMFVAVSYETETALLGDAKFANTSSEIGAELAREGVIGRINGVNVIVEDLGKKATKDVQYIVYSADYAQNVEEWVVAPHIVDLEGSSEYVGASALKGRTVAVSALTDSTGAIYKTAA